MLVRNEKGRFLGNHPSASAAVYFSWVLEYVYDPLVLHFYCKFAWRCPTSTVLTPFFNKHIHGRGDLSLCDIGVGTGYHLAHAPLDPGARVTLVDLNEHCLTTVLQRLRMTHPGVICQAIVRDALSGVEEENTLDDNDGDASTSPLIHYGDNAPFDAVSVMFLLHCLPGPVERKARMLAGLSGLVKQEDGVLFGATILGRGVQHNFLGRFLMKWHNNWGIFDNHEDDAEAFITPLKQNFEKVEWRMMGAVLLFEARWPRRRRT